MMVVPDSARPCALASLVPSNGGDVRNASSMISLPPTRPYAGTPCCADSSRSVVAIGSLNLALSKPCEGIYAIPSPPSFFKGRYPHWQLKHLRTTSRLERFNRTIRRRTRAAAAYHSDAGIQAILNQVTRSFNAAHAPIRNSTKQDTLPSHYVSFSRTSLTQHLRE